YLLRRASQGDSMALDISQHALDAMSRGGMYDLIGGGFARYSTDIQWLVPHFEKMLYDNAQLARTYLYAYMLTKEPRYRVVCEETLDFVLREMTDPNGGFYSSIDADSEGEEGLFYTWTYQELQSTLSEEEFQALTQAYTVPPEGNFEGRIILQTQADEETLAILEPALSKARKKLLAARNKRIRPATDDKVLTSWNAWMTTTFAEAGRYLQREDYLEAAQSNLIFIQENLFKDGLLLRSWRDGKADHAAYLEDYASFGLALIALYQSDFNPDWFNLAVQLANQIFDHFYDPKTGLYDTANDHQTLILRPQESQDNATPSGSSLAVQLFLTLAAYTGEDNYYQAASRILASMQEMIAAYPTAFANWLNALDFALAQVKEVAILGDLDDPKTSTLISALWETYRPNCILAASPYPPSPTAPAILADRPMLNGHPTAYVCQHFTCQAPTSDAAVLREQLTGQIAQ
ncbi:MAG: thioredoxin domain-containing protein, partial [Anaerolineales bacterium]